MVSVYVNIQKGKVTVLLSLHGESDDGMVVAQVFN
jgi:hypothetical protein